MPERVQLSRSRGWRMPPNTVSVARPTKWGNPFRIGFDESLGTTLTRSEAVAAFRSYIEEREPLQFAARTELAGKNLACWCPLTDTGGEPSPCHADVLLEIANSRVAR